MLSRYLVISAGLLLLALLNDITALGVSTLLPMLTHGSGEGLALGSGEGARTYVPLHQLVFFTPLLGGLVALRTGPRVLLVLGATLTACGYATLGVSATGDVTLPWVLLALGQGLFLPAFYATAAEELPQPHENGRNALFLSVFLLPSFTTGLALVFWFSSRSSQAFGFSVMAVLAVVLALLAGGVWHLQRRMKQPPPAPHGQSEGRGVGVLFLLGLPFLIAQSLASTAADLEGESLGDSERMRLFFSLDNLTGYVLWLPLVAGLLVCAWRRRTVPTLLLLGAGLLLFTLGTAPLPLLARVGLEDRWPLLVFSTVVRSAGELILVPLMLSRLAADTPRRFAPLVVSAWLLLANLANFVPDMVGREPSSRARGLLMLACVGCAAAAVGAVFLWRRRERGFTPAGLPVSS